MARYDDEFQNVYNSVRWKMIRAKKIEDANGLCELCLKKGLYKPGKHVHHIIPIEQDMSKAYDYDNLIVLCAECHNEQHDRISPLQEFLNEWNKNG